MSNKASSSVLSTPISAVSHAADVLMPGTSSGSTKNKQVAQSVFERFLLSTQHPLGVVWNYLHLTVLLVLIMIQLLQTYQQIFLAYLRRAVIGGWLANPAVCAVSGHALSNITLNLYFGKRAVKSVPVGWLMAGYSLPHYIPVDLYSQTHSLRLVLKISCISRISSHLDLLLTLTEADVSPEGGGEGGSN